MIIAILPARGGSKRIKKKNIKKFLNNPIIKYPITQILKSKIFDKVIVSTDNLEISKIARKNGAEVLFKRPKKLSNDYATTQQVIIHSIKWLKKNNFKPKIICCIYPTSVFFNANDLKKSYNLLLKKRNGFVISITNYNNSIERSFFLKNGKIKMFYPKNYLKRSQDLKKSYHDAAQFYWGTTKSWLNIKNLFSKSTTPYIIPNSKTVDIDNPNDWIIAEKIYLINNKKIYNE